MAYTHKKHNHRNHRHSKNGNTRLKYVLIHEVALPNLIASIASPGLPQIVVIIVSMMGLLRGSTTFLGYM